MAFLGFDLDETLGKFSSTDGYIYFFMPQALYGGLYKGYGTYPVPSPELQAKLQAGFDLFAQCLASKEPGLGLLRPGIVQIFNKLADLKASGKIAGIIIYSNNGNIASLLLASKMIEYLVGKGPLFCNHIDYYNEMRNIANVKIKPGNATKTVRVLRQSFLDPRCGNYTSINDIPVDKLFFFDDLIHDDIIDIIGDRYFQVNPYGKDANYEPITECFDTAIKSQGLDTDEEYLDYVKDIVNFGQTLPTSFEDILNFLETYNAGYSLKNYTFNDDTNQILEKLNEFFPPETGGGKYRKKRIHKTKRRRFIKGRRSRRFKR